MPLGLFTLRHFLADLDLIGLVFWETSLQKAGWSGMDMPDLRPIERMRPSRARFAQIAVAAFILLTFVLAMIINISEWR